VEHPANKKDVCSLPEEEPIYAEDQIILPLVLKGHVPPVLIGNTPPVPKEYMSPALQ